ncbi:MAG: DUF993 family protein, partial [Stackebrandtia sp.]
PRAVYLRDGRAHAKLDRSYDALLFVGQHAMAGTFHAPLAHTYSSRTIAYYRLNGVFIGEFGARAIIAGNAGVPTIYLSGDDKALLEAKMWVPEIHGAVTKLGRGLNKADHLSSEESCALIRRTAAEAGDGDLLACGVGADSLVGDVAVLDDVHGAYAEQLAFVEDCGAAPILMCSRELAALAKGPEDYLELYSDLLRQSRRPAILHWLGEMFDPRLRGYWGSVDLSAAAETLLGLIADNAGKVDGVKISLLDAGAEIDFRRRLPEGVRCYTGDDFNYPRLISGDDRGHSDALLGIFDPLAPYAAHAVRALDAGDVDGFRAVLDPTVPLARKVFEAPTRFYKTGVVFLAWLCGRQEKFTMVGGLESARSVEHLVDVFVLADGVGLFDDPEEAAARMRGYLEATR